MEDMKRAGIRNVTGVVFTESNKEQMATALKELMRSVECPVCGWTGYIENLSGKWNTTCPQGCTSELGNPQKTISRLHIPYDPELYTELNTPTYNLSKTGKIQYSHPQGTHDDRFWAFCLVFNNYKENRTPIVKV